MPKQHIHKVSFLRVATKAKDGRSGFIFRHDFGTGFQDLIFDDKTDGPKYADKLNNQSEPAVFKQFDKVIA